MIALLLAATLLTPAEQRGRELYVNGPPGGVTIGDATISAPMPCASCHGEDGRGRSEGGVVAPEITWDALSHPAPVRKRVAYDARRLIRAIAVGFDSSGNTLGTAMPRYHLTREDAADLVAFLRRLGTLREPGITDDTLRIGACGSDEAREQLQAWAEGVNGRGGIYARRIGIASGTEDVFVAIGDCGAAVPSVVANDSVSDAAQIVEATLRRAGGGVTRESFIAMLQSMLKTDRKAAAAVRLQLREAAP